MHFSAILDGNTPESGARVEYRHFFDERKGKERAIEVCLARARPMLRRRARAAPRLTPRGVVPAAM